MNNNLTISNARADISFTVNLGNYESVKISSGLDATLLKPAELTEANTILTKIMDEVRTFVISEVNNVRESRS